MARMGVVPAAEVSPARLNQPHGVTSEQAAEQRERLKAQTAPSLDKYAEVKAAVTKIAQGFKQRVKESSASSMRYWIAEWQSKCLEWPGRTAPSDFWGYEGNRSAYMINAHVRGILSRFMTSENMGYNVFDELRARYPQVRRHDISQLTYTLKPVAEVDAIVERQSEQDAEDAIQSFIAKMTKKFCGILDAKADFVSCRVTGTLNQNTLRFEFADGSGFTVINDIIINRSFLGTVFNQFPCRFTGVRLVSPTLPLVTLTRVSEAWMKRNFKSGAPLRLGTPAGKELVKGEINGQPVTMSKDLQDTLNACKD